MATENEPAKLLLPYLQRADELQKHEPLVAYYCRLYAMERGLKIPQSDRTKTTNALLVSLMKQLEKDKKSLKLGPDDHLHVEGFALNVFARADKQDRAERADLNTAKTFYAASIFFEILNQFGELQPDLEEKQKYAVWKAADIRKALKEGRKPLPGPPGGNKDLSVPSRTSSAEYDLEPRGTNFTTMPDPTRVDPAARTPPDQADDQDKNNIDQQQPANFSRKTSNVSHARPTPTDHFYPPDTFHHQPPPPPPPTNNTQYHPEPPQHFPSQDAPPSMGFHPAARTPPDQADNQTSIISHSRPTPVDHYYPPDTLHHQPSPPPTNNTSEDQHSIHRHQYHPEPPQHIPSQDAPSYSYPNLQSYPGFTESGLPTAPTHYPSFYQPNPNTSPYVSAPQYNNYNGSNEGNVSEVPSPPTKHKYEYDSSYKPPPEKIAEAHKAARFAVGALAFDDVSIAVEHLKKSLELLTNPAAGH